MTIRNFRKLRDGQTQLDAREFNRLFESVEESINFSGPTSTQGLEGLRIAPDEDTGFWAKITGNAAGTPTPHAWSRLQENGDGTFATDGEAMAGTTTVLPAYALDGSTIDTNTIVRLYRGYGGEFMYAVLGTMTSGVASPLTVEDDVPTVVMNTVTLIFTTADGFSITSSVAGEARVHMEGCDSGRVGIVTLEDAQVFGSGTKRFPVQAELQNAYCLYWGDFNSILYPLGEPNYRMTGVTITSPSLERIWIVGALGLAAGQIWDGNENVVSFSLSDSLGLTLATLHADPVAGIAQYAIADSTGFAAGITASNLLSVNTFGGLVIGGSTGPLSVPSGGTGTGTLTGHGVCLGHGTGNVTATTPGTDGEVLFGNTSTDPSFRAITLADLPVDVRPYLRSWFGI
jgi:hypothetical protein